MNSTKQPSKFSRFLRNNAALLLLIFCVLAITAVVLAVTLTQNQPITDGPVVNKPNDDDDDKKGEEPPAKETMKVYFQSPLAYTSFGLEYSDGVTVKGVYKETIKETSAHFALDLLATDGTSVSAMYDGRVIKTGYTYALGHYVVIDHGDNVIATYASLGNVQVQENEQVKQGETIGSVSTSARSEFLDGGAHLHLEVTENGKNVNPLPYVKGEISREVEK